MKWGGPQFPPRLTTISILLNKKAKLSVLGVGEGTEGESMYNMYIHAKGKFYMSPLQTGEK